MAELHPDIPVPLDRMLPDGQQREYDMLQLLADGLPAAWRIYHGLHWSSLHEGTQRYGELDIVALAPSGHLAILEVKAGPVDITPDGVFKHYRGEVKNVTRQVNAQVHAMIGRLRSEGLGDVQVCHFLLLPDFRVAQGTVAFPRERVIDAGELGRLPQRLIDATTHALPSPDLERVRDFLADRFRVAHDPSASIADRQAVTHRLASGLATWVPRIASPTGLYLIEATAGSGKTQLALALLRNAALQRQRALYVCFNRPLADHVAKVAPPLAEVATIHELAVSALRATGATPAFGSEQLFESAMGALEASAAATNANVDLLVIDESQDFEMPWIQSLLPRLRAGGRLYVMGDPDQAIYRKDAFELPDATRIMSSENFRSPRRVVQTINTFGLASRPIEARGVELGEEPGLHVHDDDDAGGLGETARIVALVRRKGFATGDIALLSFRGRERSRLLASTQIAGHSLQRFTGAFDDAGNALWTGGELLAESIYRFKGRAAPVVILCEIDFDGLDPAVASKLLVGLTRAQVEVHLVMSKTAGAALTARLA
ncbi:AAA family ATPase [Variovorax sp. LT1P1]|uniref:nuclease-related domain-containing DEAD/DEAH box helicase n=1 Tax=Variovorax sp. LT1P1 TaxID=3443730 RepID=UPI003F47D903